MYTFNETHSSLTKSPSPDDFSVYWFNATGPTAYGSPTIAEGKVFIGMGSGTGDSMLAFYVNNGTRAWRKQTSTQVSGGMGVTSTPAYSNGAIFFAADQIYALYASNGNVKWTYPVPNTLWGSGTPTVAQGKVFVGGADHYLYVLDENTGALVWRFLTLSSGGSNYGVFSPPSIWNNFVYIAGCDGYVYQIYLNQSGPTASYYHRSQRFLTMYGSPLIFDGKVYIGDGYTGPDPNARFRALSATDLSVVWTFTPVPAGTFFSSAAVAYSKIFVGSSNGIVYALDPWNHNVIWSYSTGSTIWSSPAISDGKVFVGSESNYIYMFTANQTNPANYRFRYLLNGAVDSSPAISDGRVCVGTFGGGGRIYCFGTGIAPPVNNPPTISLTNPTGAQDWTGGTSHTITWTMSDDSTPVGSLKVYLNYTSTPSSGTIPGPLTGATSYGWTVPSIDANDVRINATVIDANGLKGYSTVLVPQIDSTRPFVQSTSPTGAAVPLNVPIVVNFSETMDTASVQSFFTLVPNPGGLTFSWSQRVLPDDTLTVNHAAFSSLTMYTVGIGIGSKDVSSPGNLLAADYVWSFTTINVNLPPTVDISAPIGGERWTGGSVHTVDWVARDNEDPTSSLRVWVNYSLTGGAPFDHQIGGLQGVFGDARPYAWTVPMEDSVSVVLQGTVIDTNGAVGNGASLAFEIDSTPPQVSSTSPLSGENGVPTSVNVIATWSEAMNTVSAESAFTLKDTATWSTVPGAFSWAGNAMTFNPAAMLLPGAQYSANFTTVALDDSQPGDSLAAPYTWTFTTAMGADTTKPTLMDATAIPDPQEVYLPVNVSAVVQDNVAVGFVRLFVTDPLGGTTNTTMSYDSMAGRYYLERGYGLLGIFDFDVWAADTSGLWNSSSGQFQIVDTTAPAISDLRALPNPVAVFSQTTLSAIVTDNYQLAGVWVEVTAPDLTFTNQSMLPGARYYFSAPANQLGTYTFKVSAVDGSGNWETNSGIFQTIESVPPSIEHTPRATWPVAVPLNITANVTDDVLVQTVKLRYTDVDGVEQNVTMTHGLQDEYSYEVAGQPHSGTLSYFIWAVDGSGNEEQTQIYTTSIIERTPLPPTGLTVAPEGFGALRLQWTPPTLNTDGSQLTDLRGYNIYRMTQPDGQRTKINGALVTETTFLDENGGLGLEDGRTYYYNVTAVNSRGIESAPAQENGTTLTRGTATDNTVILIAVAIIIAVIVLLAVLILLMKRRKKRQAEQQEQVEKNVPPPPPDDS
jgi:outer membrane protein assembly factor BamB